jgi:hypothetical protein
MGFMSAKAGSWGYTGFISRLLAQSVRRAHVRVQGAVPDEWVGSSASLSSLQTLFLENNQLDTLPDDWSGATLLKFLNVADNILSSSLPDCECCGAGTLMSPHV